MELDRFTTDELLTELKNRMAIINCDITLANREFKYRLVTHNGDHSDESYNGSFECILDEIEQPTYMHTFSSEAPTLNVGQIYSENHSDDGGYEYCLTIVRLV